SFHLSYEAFHPNGDRIYRVVTELHNEQTDYTPGVPPPFAKAFRSDYSFAEKVARCVTFRRLISIPADHKKFEEEEGFACVEPAFFDILHFPMLEGDQRTALNSPNSAIVTAQIAKKYFGTTHAIGKVIRIDNKTDFTIKGILKDLPLNTDRRQEIYVADQNLKDFSGWMARNDSWGGINSETHCFVLLKPGIQPATVEKAFPAMMQKYYVNDPAGMKAFVFKMQPLRDMHFNPDYNGFADKKYLWALSLVGLFLIITACVNFVNLATAQALNRSKEVGIRKVLGSVRRQLFWQFIVETAVITFFAILLAYGLAQLGVPFINQLFRSSLTINPFINTSLLLYTLIIAILVVFLSGSYPGLILSGFQPIAALKGKLSQKNIGGFPLRRVLVVTQFAISQMLIIGAVVIASQLHYSKNSDLGFQKKGIVMLNIPVTDSTGKSKMEALRDKLRTLPAVEKISFCWQAPAADANNTTTMLFENRPKVEPWEVNTKAADDKYLTTFQLPLVAGRNLYPSDTIREFLVNESLVKKLGLASPRDILQKNITINNHQFQVVGVIKDFYNYSFRSDIAPVAIFSNVEDYTSCAVSLNLTNIKPTLAAIEKSWNEVYPDFIFKSQFLDERIARFYELDDTMLQLVELFAAIAIFIGCLGLYGLVSFMAVRKTKEIGVRKVLGASVPDIIWIFGKEFLLLLTLAFVIAAPVAWWGMNAYLQDFKYRIPIGPGIFLLAILCTLLVAAITVSYRSVKAALANPVKSLRSE
ncbi:MAG TPA: FtsX-like permease family protein, partial [Chitinophagaceae bacterium]|nr:FtsX-like permease family protein [Chitinophagaceae bacterium]